MSAAHHNVLHFDTVSAVAEFLRKRQGRRRLSMPVKKTVAYHRTGLMTHPVAQVSEAEKFAKGLVIEDDQLVVLHDCGSGGSTDRPGLTRLMSLIKAGDVATVVVDDYSRLHLPPWGDSFDKVSAKQLRQCRQEKTRKRGQKKFSREEVLALLNAASPAIKAMILLGINCALGNKDVAELELSDFNLTRGILDYPRRKTSTDRRAILWPETIKALQAAIKVRPAPASPLYADRVFLTREGLPVMRVVKKADEKYSRVDGISAYFHKLAVKAEIERAEGVNFYALRHSFRSVVDEVPDTVAINLVMGHTDQSVAGQFYIHHNPVVLDKRLKVVANHVHDWLYGVKPADENMILVSHL